MLIFMRQIGSQLCVLFRIVPLLLHPDNQPTLQSPLCHAASRITPVMIYCHQPADPPLPHGASSSRLTPFIIYSSQPAYSRHHYPHFPNRPILNASFEGGGVNTARRLDAHSVEQVFHILLKKQELLRFAIFSGYCLFNQSMRLCSLVLP